MDKQKDMFDQPVAVPELSLRSIKLAVAILDKLPDAKFAIYLPDGTSFVKDLVVAQEDDKQRLPKGSLRKLYEEQLGRMEVGDVVVITPPEHISPARLRSSMTGYAHRLWGENSHKSHITETSVEILRCL